MALFAKITDGFDTCNNNLFQFGGFGMGMGSMSSGGDIPGAQKEIIRLKGAVLYPPPPSKCFLIFTRTQIEHI